MSPLPGQSLVVLDWDDTFLPTQWLIRRSGRRDPPPHPEKILEGLTDLEKEKLGRADAMGARVLHALVATHDVLPCVVTGAGVLWLTQSAEYLLPRTTAILRAGEVSVFSARGKITKRAVIGSMVKAFAPRLVVSIGDGRLELEAVRSLRLECPRRTVRFVEAPTPHQLADQWAYIFENLAAVLEVSERDTNLVLVREPVGHTAPADRTAPAGGAGRGSPTKTGRTSHTSPAGRAPRR